jgi:PAS domain S-box-containing protein
MNLPKSLCTWSWDLDGDRVFCSESLYTLFGLDPSEPPQNWQKHAQLYTPDSFARLEAAVNECLRSGLDYVIDLEAMDKMGRLLQLEAQVTARRNEKGTIVGLTGALVNSASEEKIRKQLQLNEHTYWMSFDKAPIGMARVTMDGLIFRVNECFAEMLGFSKEELIKKSIADITHPDDLEANLSHIRNVLDGKISSYSMEKRYLSKSGREIPTLLTAYVVDDETGHPHHLVAQIQDLTTKQSVQNQLALAASALGAISQGILFADEKGRVISFNPAISEITGYSSDEILNQDLKFFVAPESDPALAKDDVANKKNGHEFQGKLLCRKKDGSTFWADLSINSVESHHQNLNHHIALVKDVSKEVRLEEIAREKTSHLKAILESPAGMDFYSLDRHCCYTEFSASHWKSMKKIWGAKIKIGQNMLDYIMEPEDRGRARVNFDRALSGEHLVLEEEYGDRALHRTYFEDHYSPIRNEEGVIIGLTCFVIDITCRKAAESKAWQEQERLHQLIEAIPDRVYFKDKDSRYIHTNKQVLIDCGLQHHSEIIGHRDTEFLKLDDGGVRHNEEMEILNGSKPVTNSEKWRTLPNGSRRCYNSIKVPMRNSLGEIIGLMGISRDITEAKEKERELTRINQELSSLHELERFQRLTIANMAAHTGVWDWDVINDRIIWDEQMFKLYGISKESFSIPYELWLKALHPDDLQETQQAVQDALTGEKDYDCEFRVIWPDGSIRFIRTMGYVQRDGEGKPTHMIGQNWDVTADRLREQMYEEAMKRALSADRAKSEFLGVMSHELKTPLNGILGFSDLILDERDLSPSVRDSVRLIQSSGKSLLRTLEDILCFSQIEGGELILRPTPFSLSKLAWHVIRIVEMAASEKALKLSVVIGEDIPGMVLGDEGRLEQVLLNLLSNGLKYTENGSITLSIQRSRGPEGAITLSVVDTGIGIPSDQLPSIFLPFTQIDSGLGRKFEGVGIGLAISQRIIKKMGSELKVKSALGVGSAFYFDLNLPDISSREKPSQNETDADIGDLNKDFAKQFPINILVVEDNKMNMLVIQRLLSTLGYAEILRANSGEEALEIVPREQPHLIFMDIQMPGINGVEATRKIRQWEHGNASVVASMIVALTANISTEIRNECFAAGMNDYLGKPINTRSLAKAIAMAHAATQ